VGEINEYSGIEIEWKRGKRAILTIFNDEKKPIEEVKLYELNTREEMHKLLTEKGFAKKTQEERLEEAQAVRIESELRAIEEPLVVYDMLTAVYLVVFCAFAVCGILLQKNKKKKRSSNNSLLTRV